MSDLIVNVMAEADTYADLLSPAIIDEIIHENGGTYYDNEIVQCDAGYQVGNTAFGFRVDLGDLWYAHEAGEDVLGLMTERIAAAYGIFRACWESELHGSSQFGYWGHYWDLDGSLCIDASVHVESLADAIEMARESGEIAIYDWANDDEIQLALTVA